MDNNKDTKYIPWGWCKLYFPESGETLFDAKSPDAPGDYKLNSWNISGSSGVNGWEEYYKSNPKYKKVVKRGDKTWSEFCGQFWVVCHEAELECGHKQIYRHTGLLLDYVECKECSKLNNAT